jgi:hypothetical protein
MKTFQRIVLLSCLVLALCISGCATVKPWDRDLLAKPEMRLSPHSLLGAIDDHIYFSKEGSTGGATAAGGGCGCN